MDKKMKKIIGCILSISILTVLLQIPCYALDYAQHDKSVCTAGGSSYFIDENHVLWGWGENSHGELGNGGAGNLTKGSTTVQTVPVKLMEEVSSVSSSGMHTLVVKLDGTLWGFGLNRCGQLGIGKQGNSVVAGWDEVQTIPVKIMDQVVSACAAEDYSLVLKTDGTLWGFGIADNLGTGNRGDTVNPYYQDTGIDGRPVLHYLQTTPAQIMSGVKSMCAGKDHAFAISTSDELWGWGENLCLGVGNWGEHFNTPQKVMENVQWVSTSYDHTLVIKSDRTLWAWGYNDAGQIGNGIQQNMSESLYVDKPVKVMDDVKAVCAASHGSLFFLAPESPFSMALKTDGTLWAWGANNCGQLGNGGESNFIGACNKSSGVPDTFLAQNTPVKIMDGVAEISAGDFHALARKNDGTVWTWGLNDSGQLGNGRQGNAGSGTNQIYQTVPIQVSFD